ncbi:MAG: ATP-dependent nuclease [Thermoanaerobaculia bacterium]
MQLQRVEIERFRAFDRMAVDFEHTTVLIGENGSGKTSVFDALLICLGHGRAASETFSFDEDDFRREPGAPVQPIRIRITIGESAAGRWDEPHAALIRPAIVTRRDGSRVVELEVTARLGADGEVKTTWAMRGADGKPMAAARSPELLRRLRELVPVVTLRSNLTYLFPDEATNGANGEAGALERTIEAHYGRLTETDVLPEGSHARERLDDGLRVALDAAQRIITPATPSERRRETRLTEEGLGIPRTVWQRGRPGSAAQRLGTLILLGAIFESGVRGVADQHASPILLVEDPEAHLHPTTLASLWGLFESMRFQRILSTNSSELLSVVPLHSIRRLVRQDERVVVHSVEPDALTAEQLRRVRYHVRARRGLAFFARSWLLVEGETEFWLLPELARLCGHDFATEGVACVEFAQCGIAPLVRLAQALGIEWHVLVDGDRAGRVYASTTRGLTRHEPDDERLTQITEPDIENCLWNHGYADVYREIAGISRAAWERPGNVIDRAIRKSSKPFLAIAAIEAMAREGSPGVPEPLRKVVEHVVRLARRTSEAQREPRRKRRRRGVNGQSPLPAARKPK